MYYKQLKSLLGIATYYKGKDIQIIRLEFLNHSLLVSAIFVLFFKTEIFPTYIYIKNVSKMFIIQKILFVIMISVSYNLQFCIHT